MGIINIGIVKSVLITQGDQKVDVYYSDSMPNNVLIKKSQYRSTRKKKITSQNNTNSNIILLQMIQG